MNFYKHIIIIILFFCLNLFSCRSANIESYSQKSINEKGMKEINSFPEMPDDFPDDEIYHSNTEIVRNINKNETGFRIKIFAIIEDTYTLDELNAIFFDFSKWPEYVNRAGADSIKNYYSVKLPDINLYERKIFRHYSHYLLEAFSPVRSWEIESLTHLWFVEPIKGAIQSLEFEDIYIEDSQHLPEVPNFTGTKGIKYRKGSIHVKELESEDDFYSKKFIIYYTSDIILTTNMLQNYSIAYISRAHLEFLKGILEFLKYPK